LAYSRVVTRGKEFEPCDCNRVLGQALANLETAIAEAGAVVIHDRLPVVKATIIGTDDALDGVERTAILKGNRLDAVKEGRRIQVNDVLRAIDHPARSVGGVIVPPWVELLVSLLTQLYNKS